MVFQVNFWPPYSKTPVQVICVFASMMPSSRPAMADRTLKVEPGGYTPLVTRFTSDDGCRLHGPRLRRSNCSPQGCTSDRTPSQAPRPYSGRARPPRRPPAVSGKVFRERTLRDLLQIEVKGRHDVVARPGRCGGLLRDLVAAEVGLHRARTGRAVQIALERFFPDRSCR